jgi:hypothetical protein
MQQVHPKKVGRQLVARKVRTSHKTKIERAGLFTQSPLTVKPGDVLCVVIQRTNRIQLLL